MELLHSEYKYSSVNEGIDDPDDSECQELGMFS